MAINDLIGDTFSEYGDESEDLKPRIKAEKVAGKAGKKQVRGASPSDQIDEGIVQGQLSTHQFLRILMSEDGGGAEAGEEDGENGSEAGGESQIYENAFGHFYDDDEEMEEGEEDRWGDDDSDMEAEEGEGEEEEDERR